MRNFEAVSRGFNKLENRIKRLSWQFLTVALIATIGLVACGTVDANQLDSVDLESNPTYQIFSESVAYISLNKIGFTGLLIDKKVEDNITNATYLITSHGVLGYDKSQIGTPSGFANITAAHGAEAGILQHGELVSFDVIKSSLGTDREVATILIRGSSDFLSFTNPYSIDLVGGNCDASANIFAIVTGNQNTPDSIIESIGPSTLINTDVAPYVYIGHTIEVNLGKGDSGSPLVSISGKQESHVCYITTGNNSESGIATDIGPNDKIIESVEKLSQNR